MRQCISDKVPLPKRIQNAPRILLGLEIFYSAYTELSSTRSAGFGSGPIPWTAIKDYAAAYEIEGEQAEDLFYFIRMMDNAYLDWSHAKNS